MQPASLNIYQSEEGKEGGNGLVVHRCLISSVLKKIENKALIWCTLLLTYIRFLHCADLRTRLRLLFVIVYKMIPMM